MAEPRYTAAQAAADLRAAGLLAGVLSERDGHLQAADPAGGFRGAGLDSRRLEPEQLFVALAGEHADGRSFAPAALAAGHWVLAASRAGADPLSGAPAAAGAGVLLSADPVAALAVLGRCWRGRQPAVTVGVTGTNGKTTTKDLLAALLARRGPPCTPPAATSTTTSACR